MSPRDLLQQAAAALAAHRLRATLSAVGIVFGIATVIAAVAIGEGARREAFDEIAALGIDNVLLRSVPPASARARRRAPGLTLTDLRALVQAVPHVASATALRAAQVDAVGDVAAGDLALAGVTVEWQAVSGAPVTSGRWLSIGDERDRARVAVLGDGAARKLFRSRAPIGGRLRAGPADFTVVGVLEPRGAGAGHRGAVQRIDADNTIFVPLGAMDVSIGEADSVDRVEEIALRVNGDPEAAAIRASREVRRLVGVTGDVSIVVPRELLRTRLRAQRTFNAVLTAIGAIALLISGIGIMNIMLASVAERTCEIGIRRAFGATRRAIVAQFAVEAALLCAIGGVVGVPVGALLAALTAVVAGWPVAVSPVAVLLAVITATSVGLAFGVYPAHVAASIQPIDALRAT